MVVSSANDELPNKQHFFEVFEEDKVKRPYNQHNWLLRDLARINSFQYASLSQTTVLDNVTIN